MYAVAAIICMILFAILLEVPDPPEYLFYLLPAAGVVFVIISIRRKEAYALRILAMIAVALSFPVLVWFSLIMLCGIIPHCSLP